MFLPCHDSSNHGYDSSSSLDRDINPLLKSSMLLNDDVFFEVEGSA